MENKINKISRRDFLKWAAINSAAAITTACAQEIKPYFPTPTPTVSPPAEFTPTSSLTETPVPIPTIEIPPLHFGELDLTNTSFKLKPTPELEKFIGYVKDDWIETHADVALPFGVSDIGSEEQYILQGEQNETFEDASGHHPLNPYYLVQSDLPNLIFFNFHSVQESAPGDYARVIGGYVFKNEKDHPESIEGLYKQKFILTFEDMGPIEAQIVDARTITRTFFDDLSATGPWRIDDKIGALYGLTNLFGIPNTIRYDQTPGVYYMTIIGCQSKEPGKISLLLSQNVVNRSLVTLKFTLP